MKNNLTIIGSAAGSVMAILTLTAFLSEPFLEDYVNYRIELHDQEVKKVDSAKIGLRTLLGQKMGVADDEVHIELGRMYKAFIIEDYQKDIEEIQKFNAKVLKGFNYYHPTNLLEQ